MTTAVRLGYRPDNPCVGVSLPKSQLTHDEMTVLTRDEIIDAAMDRETDVFDRTIDVHITAIRRKLGKGADLVQTVRGFGYRFRDGRDED